MTIRGHILGRQGVWQVRLQDGLVTHVESCAGESADWIFPGFFDIQVNGYLGIDLTSYELTPAQVGKMEQELLDWGVTRWCPTVITAAPDLLRHSLRTLFRAEQEGLARLIHCYHLEGPYISPKEGYRGIHPLEFIHPPDRAEFEGLQEAAGGRIGYVTLAPEQPGALNFIRYLSEKSIQVGLGHFEADEELIRKAVAAGARLSTHLFNGCNGVLDRHQNVVYSQLANDDLWASFIPDEYHIPYSTLLVGLRSKGMERSIFTSDLVKYAGSPSGTQIDPYGRSVIVKDEGLWLGGTKSLYGAWRTLAHDVVNLTVKKLLSIEEALRLSSVNPARFFGVAEQFQIEIGSSAPLVVFQSDHRVFQIIQ